MKKVLFAIIGVLVLVFVFSSAGFAQQHHVTYTAGHFSGDSTVEFWNTGNILGKPGEDGFLYAPVNFPDSANGMQVTRLSFSAWDNSVSGSLTVSLRKVDRWNGDFTNVCIKSTGTTAVMSSFQYLNVPKSQMVARRIDNNRWAWFLRVDFSEGDTPLYLYHVTIRYE